MKAIILASASPRRRDILEKTGLKFTVDASCYEEKFTSKMGPRALARFLSLQKAQSVAARHRNALIIAADTLIFFEGEVFGKPHTKEEALRMLRRLNGGVHTVVTGFTIIDTKSGKKMSRSAETMVHFRRLTTKQIEPYIASGEPLDKAGGYAIQGQGAFLIRKIEGDFFNVVGLPLRMVIQGLKEFGVNISLSKDSSGIKRG
ncbi:MAG TPA: Maf family protein [Thermodesulfovibrionales bacterium]|nr:Maf family protein [Thermodesulfovibrionales bacterium]